MYPYFELFGTKIYSTGLGIVLSCLAFLITAYFLCKRYNQEFLRLFNGLPWLLVAVYVGGLYLSFVLENGRIIPTSLGFLSPYGYHFSFIGVILACFWFVVLFMKQFRRSETKKVWIDILFFSFVNGIIVLGIGLLLGDNFVGKPYDWALGVRALIAESSLVKYGTVYPIGLFLSLGALILNVVITFWKFIAKKAGLWIWGFILLFVLFIGLLPFWNYPAHGVWSVFGLWTLDLNYYVFWFLIIYFLLWNRRLKKPY